MNFVQPATLGTPEIYNIARETSKEISDKVLGWKLTLQHGLFTDSESLASREGDAHGWTENLASGRGLPASGRTVARGEPGREKEKQTKKAKQINLKPPLLGQLSPPLPAAAEITRPATKPLFFVRGSPSCAHRPHPPLSCTEPGSNGLEDPLEE